MTSPRPNGNTGALEYAEKKPRSKTLELMKRPD